MKSDEGFSNMSDKIILIDCLNANVTPPITQTKFKKGSFYCPFFLYKIFFKYLKKNCE